MKQGKDICEKLKQIRQKVAQENGIDYTPAACENDGDCSGTCPACEKEVELLEEELRKKNVRKIMVYDPEIDDFIFIDEPDRFDDNDRVIVTEGIIDGFA